MEKTSAIGLMNMAMSFSKRFCLLPQLLKYRFTIKQMELSMCLIYGANNTMAIHPYRIIQKEVTGK